MKGVYNMKKKIIGIGVFVAVIGAVGFYMSNQSSGVKVNTEEVVKGNIAEYVEEIGVVKSKNEVNIYAPAAGKVSQILVDIGDKVKAGDTLVKLDEDEVSRQIEELEAQRLSVLAQYNEAKKPSNEKAIRKLELEIENMEKSIENAEEDVNKSKELYNAGAISNEEYERVVRNLDSQRRNLEKAKLDLELMKEPASQNVLDQYEAQLKQINIQKEGLQDLSKDYTITASTDGTILTKAVENGSYLQPGTAIMKIGNTEELYIESDILLGDIAKITESAAVNISNEDLGITDLQGNVIKIHPKAFSKISDLGVEQKRIKVDIEMENTPASLRPDYDLDIKIIVESKENTLIIPESAVFTIEEKEYVFVNQNGTAELREVTTGIESQRQVEILSGLEEGEIVILSPDEDIEEGVSIN